MGRKGAQARERNHQWKGGRSVASNGYVLIKVPPGHHLADVRCYAYEHRVIAEAKIGRRLHAGEHVHHRDGNKQNNAPENLDVLTETEHRFAHRSGAHVLRHPAEPNPTTPCACGCGEAFPRFDASGRPRRFVTGHNKQPSPTMDAVLAALRDGPLPSSMIALATKRSRRAVRVCLSKMKKAGLVALCSGLWLISANVARAARQEAA